MALALRLAAYELLRAEGGDPVLLLDDVFAELDTARRQRAGARGRLGGTGSGDRGGARRHSRRLGRAQDRDRPARRRHRPSIGGASHDRTPTTTPEDRGNAPPEHLAGLDGDGPGAPHPGGGPRRGRAARARTSGAAARSAQPPPGGGQAAQLVGAGARRSGPTTARAGDARPARKRAAGRRRVAEGTVFGQWPTVVGEQIAEHATPDRAARGRAQRLRRIDGVGHPIADGAGATAGQDRGGGRRRRGDVAENRRSGGAVVAQGPLSHRGPRAARHVRVTGRSAGWLRAARTPQAPFSSVLTHLGSKNSTDGANRCVETRPQNRSCRLS